MSSGAMSLSQRRFGHRGERGPGYPGLVEHLCRHDLRARREARDELLGLLRDAAPDNDEVGPQQILDSRDVLVEPCGVFLPLQVVALSGAVGGVSLRVFTVYFDVTELRVRHKIAAHEQGGSDT